MWEKAMDIGSGGSETSPKNTRSSKKDNSYKANCLTPRSCPVCARVYSNVSNLRQHMRLIHNPTAVVCPICQKHFNSDLYLKRHYSSIHSINNTSTDNESGSENKSSTNATTGNNSGNWSYNDSILQQ
jgi:Zinc-finger of C2H2 type/Zinc finger, C2H2 type